MTTRICRAALGAFFVLFFIAGTAAQAPDFETRAPIAYLVDADTGAVLLDKRSDERMAPASMSKLMTTYMVFEQLKSGQLSLEDEFLVSERAWRKGGSKMFVEVNTRVALEDLLRGIIVQSGNDACIVVAEALAGSEEAFAERMNERAREIGLTGSNFTNATGWPDPDHYMTARDVATLALRMIRDFPEYYRYYNETSFTYNDIRQGNRNPLLYQNIGADGLKTGHTEASGYALAASAKRGDRRLILVVNGLSSVRERSSETARLLDWGFRTFENYALFREGEVVEQAQVWLGERPTVPAAADRDLIVTIPRTARSGLEVKLVQEQPVAAPVEAGAPIARLEISGPGMETMVYPLVAAEPVGRLGMFGRLRAALMHVIFGPQG